MIMVEEFRAIHNFWVVIWYFPSTNMGNADFASLQESKMLVRAARFWMWTVDLPFILSSTKQRGNVWCLLVLFGSLGVSSLGRG